MCLLRTQSTLLPVIERLPTGSGFFWHHGYRGRANQRVMPSYVVWTVRDRYSAPSGTSYLGFKVLIKLAAIYTVTKKTIMHNYDNDVY